MEVILHTFYMQSVGERIYDFTIKCIGNEKPRDQKNVRKYPDLPNKHIEIRKYPNIEILQKYVKDVKKDLEIPVLKCLSIQSVDEPFFKKERCYKSYFFQIND